MGSSCNVTKVTYTTIFAPFLQSFSISLPLRGGMWHYKGTLLRHYQALWPPQLAWSIQPYQPTQHYQDYDNNHDDRAGFQVSHSPASLYSVAFCGQLTNSFVSFSNRVLPCDCCSPCFSTVWAVFSTH